MAGIIIFFALLGLSVASCVGSMSGGSMWLALLALVFSHIAAYLAGRHIKFRSPIALRGEARRQVKKIGRLADVAALLD